MTPSTNDRRRFLMGKGLQTNSTPSSESNSILPSQSDPENQTYLLELTRSAMACQFQILLNADEQHAAAETAVSALDLVESLEEQLSVFRPESQITRINQNASIQPQKITAELFQLLKLAKQIWLDSNGAFDITSTPLSRTWGFFKRQSALPPEEEIALAKSNVGCQFLRLEDQSVYFEKPKLELNLGGIGKGYALDCCHQHFATHNIESYLIHGGHSSILARGNRRNLEAQGRGWQVALKHPLIPDLKLAYLWICNTALGTSGDANQFFYHQGKRYGHVLDPRSGFPVQNTLSSTVLCPSAAAADALATAFFVLGPEHATEYCQQHPETSFMIAKPGTQHRCIELHVYGIDPADLEILAPNIKLVHY